MNRIILKPQQLTTAQMLSIVNSPLGVFKKIFFQCELRTFSSGNATFGLVAYGGYNGPGGKVIGPKVTLSNIEGAPDIVVPDRPLIFANIELRRRGQQKGAGKIISEIRKIAKAGKGGKKSVAYFTPGVSKNPHVIYDVTIGTTTELTNPSPPATPSDL